MHRKLGLGAEPFSCRAKDSRKRVHRAELYFQAIIRPICGCCGSPLLLGGSAGTYRSSWCSNATSGIQGCTHRDYKSARILAEAVLRTASATLFTDGFLADATSEVVQRLAWITRQPISSTKKLAQEIADEDRQLERLTDRPCMANNPAGTTLGAASLLGDPIVVRSHVWPS